MSRTVNAFRAIVAAATVFAAMSGGVSAAPSAAVDQTTAQIKAEIKAVNAEAKLAKVEYENSAAGQSELREKLAKARERLAKINAKMGK